MNRNVLIGAVIVLLAAGAYWQFSYRPAQQAATEAAAAGAAATQAAGDAAQAGAAAATDAANTAATAATDAATTAAIQCGLDSAGAYAPLFSTEIFRSSEWLTASLQLLSQQLRSGLTGIVEPGRVRAAASPLQAERLIPLLGYERAVQVARIAALTEKPVRLVVEKMKLLSAEQLDDFFATDDEAAESQPEIDEKIC